MRVFNLSRISGCIKAATTPFFVSMRRTRAAAVALLSADPIANQIKPAPPLQGRQSRRGRQGIEARSLKSTAHVVVAQVEPPQQKTGSPASKKKRSKAALDPSGFVQNDILSIRNKASRIASQLDGLYPNPKVPLDSASPFQLLVAVILSAQVGGRRLQPPASRWLLDKTSKRTTNTHSQNSPTLHPSDDGCQGQHGHTCPLQARCHLLGHGRC